MKLPKQSEISNILMILLFGSWMIGLPLWFLVGEDLYDLLPHRQKKLTVEQFEKALNPMIAWCETRPTTNHNYGYARQYNPWGSPFLDTLEPSPKFTETISCIVDRQTREKKHRQILESLLSGYLEYQSTAETTQTLVSRWSEEAGIPLANPVLRVIRDIDDKTLEYSKFGESVVCYGDEKDHSGILFGAFSFSKNCMPVDWVSYAKYLPLAEACFYGTCDVKARRNRNNELISLAVTANFDYEKYIRKNDKWYRELQLEAVQAFTDNVEAVDPIDRETWDYLVGRYSPYELNQ